MIVLAGDVGALRTRLALFEIENRNFHVLAFERYETKKFGNLGQMVQTFLKTTDAHPRSAAFGIAGPVIDGVCKATNLPWTIDVAKLSKAIGIPRTAIVNDFVAHAHGLPAVRHKDLAEIQRGTYEGLANQVLLGPGTGLGEAIVAQHGGDTIVVPSEGGHKDFAPHDKLQAELLTFLQEKFGHVSYERVLSGPGILNIYEFLKKQKHAPESGMVAAAFRPKDADKPAIIAKFAAKDKLCRLTAETFFSILGAEAGNLALQATALSGVYLIGSGVRDNLALLKHSPFLKSFRNKGRLSSMMQRIPVYVVKNEQMGLLGAAALASDLF
jgi:glucokinase